jgi:hypothetical protein
MAMCKMELDDDTDKDIKMEEGYERYRRLQYIIHDLKTNSLCRTAEWYTDHNELMMTYEKHFKGGFSDIHPEITEPAFRKNCVALDSLLTKLLRNFDDYQWFSLYDYLVFNETALAVVDYVFSFHEEEENSMNQLFAKMKV